MLKFERRDIILVIGLLLFMVGLLPFMAPIYAVAIVAAMFVGLKVYVAARRHAVQREVGDGICMECGSSTRGRRCPVCDAEP